MSSKVGIIIRREYMERVTKKSFIITTLLMPLLMLALMFTPILIAEFAEGDTRNLVVVDNSGVIAPEMKSTSAFNIVKADSSWEKMLESDQADAVVFIPQDILKGETPVELLTSGASSMILESATQTMVQASLPL